VREILLLLLQDLRDDWEYSGEITEQTQIFADLGLESVDAVALGAAIEEEFDQTLPYPEFLARLRDRGRSDISIGDFLDFLMAHLKERRYRSAAG